MAIELAGTVFEFRAATDMSTYGAYKLVKLAATAFSVDMISAATDVPIGIIENTPSAGQGANVRLLNGGGFGKVQADAVIGIGSPAMASADGQVASAVYGGATGTAFIVGVTLEAATAAGDFITLSLEPAITRGVAS